MKDNKIFWDRIANNYEKMNIEKNQKAYDKMISLIIQELNTNMNVLELATGTGFIARRIAPFCKKIVATDYSEEMIKVANTKETPQNLSFGVQDATNLNYPNNTFDVVIISNALHIMPNPQKALSEIKRVLKDNGILIAPTFTVRNTFMEKLIDLPYSIIRKFVGLKQFSKWEYEQYLNFIKDNNWNIEKSVRIEAYFPMAYIIAKKQETNTHKKIGFFVYEMEYKGDTLKSDLKVNPFETKYYDEYKKVYEDCFEKMRIALNSKPYRCCNSLEDLMKEKENIFILLDNSEIIGAVTCLKNEIDDLIVNQKYQKQGFGGALTRFAISHMQKRGDNPIKLHVTDWNKNAIKLYEKLGFIVIKKEWIDRSEEVKNAK